MSQIQFTIDSSYDSVPEVGEAVRGLSLQSGLGELQAGLCELAVVEGINNAIEHAYGGRPGGWIRVTYTIEARAIRAEIVDAGAPVDPAAVTAHPTDDAVPADRDALPEGGRGLTIIRSVFDDVSFERQGDENHLRLEKRRPADE